jgi:hypothetical protein
MTGKIKARNKPRRKRLAVHLHLYYMDQADFLLDKLRVIKSYSHDLFVTMAERNPETQAKILAFDKDAKIMATKNIGADIWPFIKVLDSVDLDDYDFVVKIHSKRFCDSGWRLPQSRMKIRGYKWRDYSLSFLSPRSFAKTMAAFAGDRNLGMVCDWRILLTECQKFAWDRNACDKTLAFMKERGLPGGSITYPAGTMFIARAGQFGAIKNLDLKESDFSEFVSGTSGRLPHVLERLCGSVFANAGYAVADVYTPEWIIKSVRIRNAVREFFNRIPRLISRFVYHSRITNSGHHLIKIMKIPVWHKFAGIRDKVIYTCITECYDKLKKHRHIFDDCEYVCFTDNKDLLRKKKYGRWEIRPMAFDGLENVRNARWHKTHPHVLFPEYEVSLWVDANIDLISDGIFRMFGESGNKIMTAGHFSRDCIYDECMACVDCRKESEKNALRVARMLGERDMPRNYGLCETNLLLRRHNDKAIVKLCGQWWRMIEKYSHRDQMSFTYILWKNGLKPSDISFPNERESPVNYKWFPHDCESKAG